MKKNVSTIDAIMRITVGLTGVAWGTSEMIRHPRRMTPLIVTMASAMKVAEGITRYCPMIALMDRSSNDMAHGIRDSVGEMVQSTAKKARKVTKTKTREGFDQRYDQFEPLNDEGEENEPIRYQ